VYSVRSCCPLKAKTHVYNVFAVPSRVRDVFLFVAARAVPTSSYLVGADGGAPTLDSIRGVANSTRAQPKAARAAVVRPSSTPRPQPRCLPHHACDRPHPRSQIRRHTCAPYTRQVGPERAE
jgi:hypothetical protein